MSRTHLPVAEELKKIDRIARILGQLPRESLVGAASRIRRDPRATPEQRRIAAAIMGPGDPFDRIYAAIAALP